MNLKFPNASKYHFEKFNGLVFEPLVNGTCNNKVLSSEGVSSNAEDDLNVNSIPNNYFPELIINDNYEAMSSNSEKKSIRIPESLTTWRFFGISVHPERGFTVSKVQPKINVNKELAVQIRSPTVAYGTEAFKIEVRVYNPLNERISVQGSIKIDNGFIFEKTLKTEFGLTCEKLSSSGTKQKQLSMNLSPEQISNPTSFLVKSNGNENVIIKVSVTGGANREEVEKVVKILKPGSHQTDKINTKNYGSLLDQCLNGLESM